MDLQLRNQYRQIEVGDLASQVRYLKTLLRSHAAPTLRHRIHFAAYMGDAASKHLSKETPLFSLSKVDSKDALAGRADVWREWKFFGRVLGKAPSVAALIPCIEHNLLWHLYGAADAQKELLKHYRAKLADKRYRPTIKHKLLRDCRNHSYWDSFYSEPQFGESGGYGRNPNTEEVKTLLWLIQGCQNYSVESSYILQRNASLETDIKQSCIRWALDL